MAETDKPIYADQLADWLRMDNWNAHEAICLFCEADPRKAKEKMPFLDQDWGLSGVDEASINFEAMGQYLRLERIWNSGHEWTDRHPPIYFIEWAEAKNIDVPWLAWARQQPFLKNSSAPSTTEREEGEGADKHQLHPRTRNNFLRLIIALASGIEGFDPKRPYVTARAIVDATGVKVDEKTIATYISEAYEQQVREREP